MDPVLVRQVDRAIGHESHAEQAGVDIGAAEVTSIANEISRAKHRRDAASNPFYDSKPDDPMRDDYDAGFRKWAGVVKRLETTMQRAKAAPSPAPQAWNAGAGTVLAGLARLRTTTGSMPAAVVKSLHRVLSGFTVTFDEKTNTITWRAGLLIPDLTNRRDREIGPLQGPFPSEPQVPRPRAHGNSCARCRASGCMRRRNVRVGCAHDRDGDARGRLCCDGRARRRAGAPVRRGVLALAWPRRSLPRTLPWLLRPDAGQAYIHDGRGQLVWNEPGQIRQPLLDHCCGGAPQTSEIYLTLALHPRGPCTRRFEPPVEPGFPALSSTACLRGPPKTVDSGSSPSAGHARTVAERWTWLFGPENAQADSFAVLACACPSSGRRSSPATTATSRFAHRHAGASSDPPDWWNGLARAVDEPPDANVTVLARMLKRRRWEIRGREALKW